jgi:protein-tyrosine phosphatase
MTLGNMRANGVRTLAAWCLGRGHIRTTNEIKRFLRRRKSGWFCVSTMSAFSKEARKKKPQ